jgi:RecA-family ATPase
MYATEDDYREQYSRAAKFWNRHNDTKAEGANAAREAWISGHFRHQRTETRVIPTTDWLLKRFERAIFTHDAKVLVIDPFNALVRTPAKGESDTNAINRFLQELERLAQDLRVLVLVLHHTTPDRFKEAKGLAPRMSDVADSSNFPRHANHVLMPWRWKRGRSETLLQIEKSKRHHVTGREGAVWVTWDEDPCLLSPLDYDPVKREKEKEELLKAAKKAAKSSG